MVQFSLVKEKSSTPKNILYHKIFFSKYIFSQIMRLLFGCRSTRTSVYGVIDLRCKWPATFQLLIPRTIKAAGGILSHNNNTGSLDIYLGCDRILIHS